MGGAVVINADDLGVSRGATLGVLKAHQEGIVTSASLAATGADYRHAVEACVRDCPGLGVGLHFTLSFGKPVAPVIRVPLLVNSEGFLRWRFTSLLRVLLTGRRKALLEQIEIELEAQLDRLQQDGVQLDHIDSERHIHLIPPIFEKVAAAAERRQIPFVRLGRDLGWRCVRAGHWPTLIWNGGIAKFLLLAELTRRCRRLAGAAHTADHFASYLYSGHLDLIMDSIASRLPENGVTEIMVHPGLPEESRSVKVGNRELERYLNSEDRRRELTSCLKSSPWAGRLKLCNFAQLAGSGAP